MLGESCCTHRDDKCMETDPIIVAGSKGFYCKKRQCKNYPV